MTRTDRQLVVMFADISGSTRLYEMLGDAIARRMVADCLLDMRAIVQRHGGTVVKTIGDELMCSFADPERAYLAACEMQEARRDDPTGRPDSDVPQLRLRIGMHYGPVIEEDGDLFGDAVNVAARMAGVAKAEQIITTDATVAALPPMLRLATRCIDHATVKGKQDVMDIHEVIWQQDDVTRMSTRALHQESPDAELELLYQDLTLVVGRSRPQVVLGRGRQADIAIEESLASRQHVRIEHRRGRFFIVDQSTNGTYLELEGRETFLRRDELPLTGRGRISLGRAFTEADVRQVIFLVRG